ncbi:hypothetical protein ACL7TT_11525 [Microbulbifer sp. 2304DJ12-6]|uniref:hypothetical protein n=1 Tax=Microbulbifer sp. 2304DJ12-6 TaxID=3233340 RepID=UPI0039AEF587
MNFILAIILGLLSQIIPIGIGGMFIPHYISTVIVVVLSGLVYGWAVNEVARREFRKYDVPFTGNRVLASVFFLLFNVFALSIFYYSWLKIRQEKAVLESERPVMGTASSEGDPWKE